MSTKQPTTVTIATSKLTTLSQLDRALLSAINACHKLNYNARVEELLDFKQYIDVEIKQLVTNNI